jgi:hypothetical protein
MDKQASIREWVGEQLGEASFGDARREMRARLMLRRAAEAPAGRLSEVFRSAAELQAAYDFVEGAIPPDDLVAAFARASLRVVASDPFVYVPVDGTSLSLTDRKKTKDFGSIGKRAFPTRGLKIMDAIAVDHLGTPVGLLDLVGWARGPKASESRWIRRQAKETETHRWVNAIERVCSHMQEMGIECRPWFLMDREADSTEVFDALARTGAHFTLRANQNRLVRLRNGGQRLLRTELRRRPVVGRHRLEVLAGAHRTARVVSLDVRFGEVVLDLPLAGTRQRRPQPVRAVWVRERHPPRDEPPIDWLLLTDRSIATYVDAIAIVESYCHRWRIEDFHRSWKRGGCNVEDTQLRASDHVLRWATMLAAVAMRLERLKHLARSQPDVPASIDLSPIEIQALRAEAERIKKRTETIPEKLTIAEAVHWIARMGGYQGKPTSQPGAITLGRGLERFLVWADGFAFAMKLAKK